LGAAVVAPAAILTALLAFVPSIRSAMLSISLPALVAVQAIRLLGVIFVALYAQGRLPAPFAPSAGWGDIGVGVAALPVAALMARFGSRVRPVALCGTSSASPTLSSRLRLAPPRRRVRSESLPDRRRAP
jgi:hypothetical protein